jgi:hypothetical protein
LQKYQRRKVLRAFLNFAGAAPADTLFSTYTPPAPAATTIANRRLPIEFQMIRSEFFSSEDELNPLSREALCLPRLGRRYYQSKNSTVLLYSGGRPT